MLTRLRSSQKQAAASCNRYITSAGPVLNSPATNDGDKRERQQLSPRTYFKDHTRWWDDKRQKIPRSSDFHDKDAGDALWFDNHHKPDCVDPQLATPDTRTDHITFVPSLSSDYGDQLAGPELLPHGRNSSASFEGDKRERQFVLWRTFFRDHTRWWDNRHQKTNPRLPDFRHKESEEALWLDNYYKPAWVDAQLAILDERTKHSTVAASLLVDHADQLIGSGSGNRFTPEFVKKLCQQGQVKGAIRVLELLVGMNFGIDKYILYSVLKKCVEKNDLMLGDQVHALAVKMGFGSDTFLCNHFIRMYSGHGKLREAADVFKGVALPDAFMWSSIISAYAKHGQAERAIEVYHHMRATKTKPNNYVFVAALQACAAAGDLQSGKQIHNDALTCGMVHDLFVCNCLVDMYAKCGSLTAARMVFDGLLEKDVVTWNAMISGYAQQDGMGQEALSLHTAMHENSGMAVAVPDRVTFVSLLQACANVGVSALEKGKQLHSELKERGFESDVVVAGCLLNMYAKCGSLPDARIVFNGLEKKNVVTWTAMIAGYAQQEGMGQEALNFYKAMRSEGMATPDAVTYVFLLEACASVGALQQGKVLHWEIRQGGFESNVRVGTCLVKMYARCGRLELSREVFDRLPIKDLVLWNALLHGYAEHGEVGMAIQCFEELLEQDLQPDEVTYICLLTACSHAGLVDLAQQYFENMEERHGVRPDDRHCTCMVDLLGRSGHLERAEQMLRTSGLASSAVSWRALLSACKSYGDADLGTRCFDHLVNLQPTVSTPYVLLGSIYANAGRWDEVERVEMLRKAAGVRKKAAKACIEVNEEVLEFTVGEERSDIAAASREMNTRVKEGGHVPQTRLVLRTVSEQEKEDALCGHAEKLALAYGLLNTPTGSPLVVTKNLRMCDDCHSSTKIMSRVEKREIVVRDGHKVHRFQNGFCSCQDRP